MTDEEVVKYLKPTEMNGLGKPMSTTLMEVGELRAQVEDLSAQLDALIVPPGVPEWTKVIQLAYADDSGEGCTRIYRITAEYNRMKASLNAVFKDFDSILGPELLEQCRSHASQWGGHEHDDTHFRGDWIRFIRKQLDKAFLASTKWNDEGRIDEVEFENRLKRVAALAIDAIQSSRRKRA